MASDHTSLSSLTADAVESLDEAVALVIELGELAIDRGGHEGSLPPLRAIAIDPFGTLSVVGEDKTLDHPVRIMVRTLKWLVRRRDIPPELRELLARNSGRADDLDYPEELVNALLPFAPPDRGEALSIVAKRLWQLERKALQPSPRRSAVMFVPAATRQVLLEETRQLGHHLAVHRNAVAIGSAVAALLLLVSVIGAPVAREVMDRTTVSASPLPIEELSAFLAQLPEPTAVPLAIALADPPSTARVARTKRSVRTAAQRSKPRTRTANREPRSTETADAPERPNAAFRAIGQGSKTVARAVGKGSMAFFRAVGKGSKAVFRPGNEANRAEDEVQQSNDTADASSTSLKTSSRARRRTPSASQ